METISSEVARALMAAPKAPHYRAIGEFFVEFSRLEYVLKLIYFECIGASRDAFEIATTQSLHTICTGITILCTARYGEDKQERLSSLLSEIRGLVSVRHHIAHAVWHDGATGLVDQFVPNNSLKAASRYENVKDIEKATNKARRLANDVLTAYLDLNKAVDPWSP